jgi:hypothetical protein
LAADARAFGIGGIHRYLKFPGVPQKIRISEKKGDQKKGDGSIFRYSF